MAKAKQPKPTAVMGIDPGLNGGIAVMDYGKREIISAIAMPYSDYHSGLDLEGIVDHFKQIRKTHEIAFTELERVHAMPKQGVTSMFTFGKGFGELRGIMAAMGIPFVMVRPQDWKSILSGNHDKAAAIEYCQTHFPDIDLRATARSRVPHDGIADAICLCDFARKVFDQLGPPYRSDNGTNLSQVSEG